MVSDYGPDAVTRSNGLRQQEPNVAMEIQLAIARKPRVVICCVYLEEVEIFFPNHEPVMLGCGDFRVDLDQLIQEYQLDHNDVFMGDMMQGEVCTKGGILNFPGKHLYLNPEAVDEMMYTPRDSFHRVFYPVLAEERKYDYLPPGDNVFVIGPHPDTQRSISISIGLYLLVMRRPNEIPKLADPHQRPRNTKRHFMGYFQSHHVGVREIAFRYLASQLADIDRIHVGERCQGNPIPPRVPHATFCAPVPPTDAQAHRIKVVYEHNSAATPAYESNASLESDFRFIVAFENQYREGYITEKLINAFLSGAIPVYWGSRKVLEIFNPKAFIYYDIADPEPAIEQIRRLEANPGLYEQMLSEPILRNGVETVREYMSFRPEIGHGALRQRVLDMMEVDD